MGKFSSHIGQMKVRLDLKSSNSTTVVSPLANGVGEGDFETKAPSDEYSPNIYTKIL